MIKFNKSELSELENKLSVALDTLKNKEASNYKQVQAAKFILKNEGLVSRSNILLAKKLLDNQLLSDQAQKAEAVLSDMLSTEHTQTPSPISQSASDYVKRK